MAEEQILMSILGNGGGRTWANPADASGEMWEVTKAYFADASVNPILPVEIPLSALSVAADGKLQVTVTVEGQYLPPDHSAWRPFGPEQWVFTVTASQGIRTLLALQAPAEKGSQGNDPMAYLATSTPGGVATVTDLSGPDADELDKYVASGRGQEALDLLTRILS